MTVGFGSGVGRAGGTGGDEAGQPIAGPGASVTVGLQGKQKRVGWLMPADGTHGEQAGAGPSVTGHLDGGIVVPGPASDVRSEELSDPGATVSPGAPEFIAWVA